MADPPEQPQEVAPTDPAPGPVVDPTAQMSDPQLVWHYLKQLFEGQSQVVPAAVEAMRAQSARDRSWAELYDTVRQWLTPAGWKELFTTRGGQILALALAIGSLSLFGIVVDVDHLVDVAGRMWAGECVP